MWALLIMRCVFWHVFFACVSCRAFYSLRKCGIEADDVRMAVCVMRVVPARYAFVIHTKNPSNNDANEVRACAICVQQALQQRKQANCRTCVVWQGGCVCHLVIAPAAGDPAGGLWPRSPSHHLTGLCCLCLPAAHAPCLVYAHCLHAGVC